MDDPIPPLRTPIELPSPYGKVFYNAMLDTGASHNLLSFATWNQLDKPHLEKTEVRVEGINAKRTTTLCVLKIPIFGGNQPLVCNFLVMPSGTMKELVILGRAWMSATQCGIDWAKKDDSMVQYSTPITHQSIPNTILQSTLKDVHIEEASFID